LISNTNTQRTVPIKPLATSLSLPLHQIDTFTNWTPPPSTTTNQPPNLIITVSFGLLVPARILKSASHGGLNVHPSLLPDLRGPAPLQHALLRRREFTGVSLQTMHPTKFDHGVVLAQTPPVGIAEGATPGDLLEMLGPMGAELLVKGIEYALFVPPLRDVSGETETAGFSKCPNPVHAPKIAPADREINWASWTADEILLRDRALGGRLWDGSLWARAGLDEGQWDATKAQKKFLRATFAGPWRLAEGPGVEGLEAGTPFLALDPTTGNEEVRFATVDGKAVVPAAITQESGKKGQGAGVLVERLRGGGG
jgi:methionyl-tRNA formyltransferase